MWTLSVMLEQEQFLIFNKMRKVILTDCDDVLVDWLGSFEKFMERKEYVKVPNTEHEYSFAVRYNISSLKASELVKEFNESSHIEHLLPFLDSSKYVKKLGYLGFKFIVVTSLGEHPESRTKRIKNLESIFGKVFEDVHCVSLGGSKEHVLKNWADSGYFWIEDHMRHAEAGHELGLRSVLIRRPHNSHYKTDLFPIVGMENPWKEIYELICAEYNLMAI